MCQAEGIVKDRQPLIGRYGILSTGSSEPLRAVTRPLLYMGWSRSLVVLLAAVTTLGLLIGGEAAAQTINFPYGFTTADDGAGPGQIYVNNAGYISGTSIQIGDSTGHRANNAWYTTPVNVQAFTTTFTFHIDCSINPTECGQGFGFMMISASPTNPAYNPPSDLGFTYSGFASSAFSWAQCNAGACNFYNSMIIPFAMYDANSNVPGAELTGYYVNGAAPQSGAAIGFYAGSIQYDMSGSGINLQSGDEFTCTIAYNGAIITETLKDTVTGQSYTNGYAADIPYAIGEPNSSPTSLVGFGAGVGVATSLMYIDSWTYAVLSSGAATPTYSVPAGSYGSAQAVTLSTTSAGAVICYSTTQSPATDGSTGCSAGTMYTGTPVSVAASGTLYAVAGGAGYNDSVPVGAATYVIDSQVSAPVISLPSGSYSFPQSATVTTTTTQTTTPVTSASISTCSTSYGSNCTPSTALSGAITISAASTVCANATNAGFSTSPTVCYSYAAIGSPTSTTLEATPTSASTGQSVALTATVTSGLKANTPTGTVTFYNGSIALGTAALGPSGTATLSITTLAAGSDSITAAYGGDDNDTASTSTPIIIMVMPSAIPTFITLTASATQITAGQSVAFTVKVTPQGGDGVPAGSINFFEGITSLGKASLNRGGTATLFTTALAVGTHSITASYFGDAQDSGAVSQSLNVVVMQAMVGTRTTLTASTAQTNLGVTVVFAAKVMPQVGNVVPVGSINFFDGTKSLGKASLNPGGNATFRTAALAVGTHSITASYYGNSEDSSSVSPAVAVTVTSALQGNGVVATTTTPMALPPQ